MPEKIWFQTCSCARLPWQAILELQLVIVIVAADHLKDPSISLLPMTALPLHSRAFAIAVPMLEVSVVTRTFKPGRGRSKSRIAIGFLEKLVGFQIVRRRSFRTPYGSEYR